MLILQSTHTKKINFWIKKLFYLYFYMFYNMIFD